MQRRYFDEWKRSIYDGFQRSEDLLQLDVLHLLGAKPGHQEMKLRIDRRRQSPCGNLLGLFTLFPPAFLFLLFLSRGRDLMVRHARPRASPAFAAAERFFETRSEQAGKAAQPKAKRSSSQHSCVLGMSGDLRKAWTSALPTLR